jgi:pimeloyl-ACP methyl ester carboxylesterase
MSLFNGGIVPTLFALLSLVAAAPPAGAAAVAGESVTYASDVPLAAELLRPTGPGPWPAAVIVHGSGASDRSNEWARSAAEMFVRRGIAVLLTDKRGSGASGGDWRTAGFDELAADALAGVAYLATRPEIDPTRIGLVGLSQGGWIVPIAAARAAQVRFVVDLSGGTVSFVEQSCLEMANTARRAGLSDAGVATIVELNRAAGRYLLGGPWDAYAAARADALDGETAGIAAGFPGSPEAPIWSFLRKVAAFDPLPYWAVVTQPVFIGLGEADERDNVPVIESVRRIRALFDGLGKRDAEVVVAPEVGHALWTAPGVFSLVIEEALERWLVQHDLGRPAPRAE